MRLVSTGGRTPETTVATALRRGLAPDGGLYVPTSVTPLAPEVIDGFDGAPLVDIAEVVLGHLLADAWPRDVLAALIREALDFPIPIVPIDDRRYILELFHGPTLAFKDVAARVMARLLPRTLETGERLTVLTATSGDTGGAVAQAFHGVPDTRVAVLYPRGRVTAFQERQFATLGGNVRAFAVDGSFDDCQRLVKGAFADEALAERLCLTSANSINIGRLLPQAVYYFHAVAQLRAAAPGAPAPTFCVPSGNFGNLTAGLLALRLGLRCHGFVAATNINDVVPAYLDDGRYQPRPSQATLSSAMDVGDPSNFARILHLYHDDRQALKRDVRGCRFDDAQTEQMIGAFDRQHDYLLDPHTAVGCLAADAVHAAATEVRAQARPTIVLATAHPVKFREVVAPAIGRAVDLPAAHHALMERPLDSRPLANRSAALRAALLRW